MLLHRVECSVLDAVHSLQCAEMECVLMQVRGLQEQPSCSMQTRTEDLQYEASGTEWEGPLLSYWKIYWLIDLLCTCTIYFPFTWSYDINFQGNACSFVGVFPLKSKEVVLEVFFLRKPNFLWKMPVTVESIFVSWKGSMLPSRQVGNEGSELAGRPRFKYLPDMGRAKTVLTWLVYSLPLSRWRVGSLASLWTWCRFLLVTEHKKWLRS